MLRCVRFTSQIKNLGVRVASSAAAQTKPIQNERAERMETKKAQDSQSFVMNLFRGRMNVEQVLPFPEVLNEEQKQTLEMLVEPVEKFFETQNNPEKNDANEEINPETLQGLREMGAFGLQVPAEYGGLGLTNTQYGRLVEIVGAHDLGIGIALGAHQSIGFKGILLFGTKEQKAKYLPDLASGKTMASFCLTEPTSGSDASSIKTRVELSKDGSHYIMNGGKIWISNGGYAEIFTVFAQMAVKDEKSGEMKDKVTAFIVERKFGGVTNGPPEKKMGIKCSNTAEVYFDDVKIPKANLLGEEGGGFKVAMEILNNGRFGMGAALSGTMKACIRKAVEHASTRTQFGQRIDNYGAIQEKISNMMIKQYVTESMAFMISSNMDLGAKDYQLEAAISKIYASEAAWFCADEAIQVLGGMGFMRSSGLERVVRDLRIFRIFEGTNDILRLFVALTGLQFAGGHLRELAKALKNPAANVGLVFGEGTKRALRMVGMRTHNGSPLNGLVHSSLKDSADQASRAVEDFGVASENILRKYGKKVIDEQFLLYRIAESAIDIYGMVSVLSRATRSLNNNYASAENEQLLASVFCDQAAERVAANLKTITSGRHRRMFDRMSQISIDTVAAGGPVPRHPLGF